MTDITYNDEQTDDIVARAKAFALAHHGGQMYGDVPYEAHLQAVVDVMTDFGFTNPNWLAAAWLHDVIEDTKATRKIVKDEFGDLVANIVWAVTGVGKKRKDRNQAIYDKMLTAPEASVLKVADRIANVEFSAPGSQHRLMYVSEAESFYDNVARFAPFPMRDRLDMAYRAG
jgi:(p)ppGpp synthase/HD superfamily hydrolase